MAIPTPDILLAFDDGTGTSITNYGSLSPSSFTVASDNGSSDWTWADGATPEDDYLFLKDNGAGGGHGYVTLNTATLPGKATNRRFAIAFRIYVTSLSSDPGYLITAENNDQGMATIKVVAPTGGGNFNLSLIFESRNYGQIGDVVADLSFNTEYSVVMQLEPESGNSVSWKYKINSDSVVSGSDTSTTDPFNQDFGYLCRQNFTTHYGTNVRWYYFIFWDNISSALTDTELANINSDPTTYVPNFPGGGATEYSAGGSTGIQNYIGFQASQIGIHRNVTPGIAEFNALGFAPSTSAGRQIDAAVGYANAVGFGAQAIYDSVGIAGRINFNTGTHQTHVTRTFFGLLGQLRALGFLVDQTNSQGFFPNLGSIVFQGPTGATVTVVSPPTTFTATSLLRETHFVGFQAQTIRDFFPISASTHALGFTPQYVEFIKEITGPTTGEVNFSGFQAQAIILGQINDAIGQKGEVNLVGFQHAVDMWRTLDILQGRINMQGFAAGVAIFQGGTVNLSGVTGEINFDTLTQAVSMYRTFYPDSGLTNAEGFNPTAAPGLSVQSIVGILNQEGFVPFIVSERYRGIVGEATFSGFAPTIGGGLWTPKRRRATSWAAIN